MAKQVIDPWLEDADGFTRVDFSIRPEDALDPDDPGLDVHPGLEPDVVVVEGGVPVASTPAPVAETEPEGPEVFQVEDGTVTLEKEKGQWKCTLESGTGGQPQVYWGKTKNDLLVHAMAKAQLNATKKIRELNAKLKFGTAAPKPVPVAKPLSKELNADDIFEIKTQLESNPDLALSNYFQKKTGLTLEQLVGLAQKGANADANLETEAVGKDFMARNTEYYACQQNLNSLTKWLGKYKLGNTAADVSELYAGGVWTVENLEEAFQDLNADGLLAKAPKPVIPQPISQAPPAPESQPRTDERIVRTETRPRAALGLRTTDVAPAPLPVAPKAPSVEDLDNLSDEAVRQLLAGVKRQKIMSRRSQ